MWREMWKEPLKNFLFLGSCGEEKSILSFFLVSVSNKTIFTQIRNIADNERKTFLGTKKFRKRERIQGMLFFKSSGIIIKNNKRRK